MTQASRMAPIRLFTFTINPLLAPACSMLYDDAAEQTEPSELIQLDCTVTPAPSSTFFAAELHADATLLFQRTMDVIPSRVSFHFSRVRRLLHLPVGCSRAARFHGAFPFLPSPPPSAGVAMLTRRLLQLSACRVCHPPVLLTVLPRTTSHLSYSLTRNYVTFSFSLPFRFPFSPPCGTLPLRFSSQRARRASHFCSSHSLPLL